MKITSIILLMVFGTFSSVQGMKNAKPQVSYIGFNTLKVDQKVSHNKAFNTYIAAILPIMAKYDMGLQVYRVDHNSNPEIPVDYITFGTAPDQTTFQKFFADAELQAQFPKLVDALQSHFVTFLDQPIMPKMTKVPYTQLTLDWLINKDDETKKKLAGIDDALLRYASNLKADKAYAAEGLFATIGLTDDVVPVEPPSQVAIWHMEAPHDFLENKEVRALNKQAATLSKDFRSYWITRQHY
ncbi:hypothetical protein [Kordiimonas aquimaris]|uniref:hypothetical protein n=1 Tax=Kordiimonas aquimaris TaxID=707591 RepID=UPI0021D3D2E8|nr:hypothetical protein [Kordiimonas aquimaris]